MCFYPARNLARNLTDESGLPVIIAVHAYTTDQRKPQGAFATSAEWDMDGPRDRGLSWV